MRTFLSFTPPEEKMWVPLEEGVWVWPLSLNFMTGERSEVMRVRKEGWLTRYSRMGLTHGYVIRGAMRFVEQKQLISEGDFFIEAASQDTSIVMDSDDEMQALYVMGGPTAYMDEGGKIIDVEDNKSLLAKLQRHYRAVGEMAYLDRIIVG